MSQVACKIDKTTLETDSHAETLCLGRGSLVLYDYDQPVNVQRYDLTLGAKKYSTVSGSLAYSHPFTGSRYHLLVHQDIHVPDLEHHLLFPMQCRAYGNSVNSYPPIDAYMRQIYIKLA